MDETKKTKPTEVIKGQEVLQSYEQIRVKYLMATKMASSSGSTFNPPTFVGGKGFYRHIGPTANSLTTRFGGLDKLFYTLIQGIVEDPDYAIKKDSKIYQRMLRDPQIYYCLEVRKAATSSLPWIIRPPKKFEEDKTARQIASDVERRLRQIPRFPEFLDNILDSFLPGMSINELVWRVTPQSEYVVQQHFPMNKDRFKFDRNGGLRLLSPKSPTVGIAVPQYKFIKHLFTIADGSWIRPNEVGYNYYGRGLADTPLYHYFHFKVAALKFMLQSMERSGFPAKILYSGAQNSALAEKLAEIMTALKNDAVVNIPGKFGEVKVEQFQVKVNWQLFMKFMEYVDHLITRAILGQDLMTEVGVGGAGSYAQAQVHQSVFQLLQEKDQSQLAGTLTRTLVAYDCILNCPQVAEEMWPIFQFKKNALTDALPFLQVVESAVGLGITVSESQVRELTGLREPQENEAIIERPEPEMIPTQPGMGTGQSKPPVQSKSAKRNMEKRNKGQRNGTKKTVRSTD